MHGWFESIFFTFQGENFVWKSLNKIKPQSPNKNKVDTYKAKDIRNIYPPCIKHQFLQLIIAP